MSKFYTGIGARASIPGRPGVPPEFMALQVKIGYELAKLGWVLRSGGANGSDSSFEQGVDKINSDLKRIYLPYDGFNKRKAKDSKRFIVNIPFEDCYPIAAKAVPHWDKCNATHRKFHGRNVCQVLGLKLKTPSKFGVCWTFKGQIIGGTATALNIMEDLGIPYLNLGQWTEPPSVQKVLEWIDKKVGL